MWSPRRLMTTMVIALLVIPLDIQCVEGTDDLEVFAGSDMVVKQGQRLYFNEARIVRPEIRDPDQTYTFRWDFSDMIDLNRDGIMDNDNESYEQYTWWRFHDVGEYVVTLTLSNGVQVAKDTVVIEVVENLPPVLSLPADHHACVGEPTRLNVTASDPDDDLATLMWEWRLGDERISVERGPITHTFEDPGLYDVTVLVWDDFGNQVTGEFTVTVIDDRAPRCDAGPDVSIKVNGTVRFNGSRSRDNIGITSWTWSFVYNGSLVVLTGPEPEFTFRSAGSYVVGLKVSDEAGNEDSDTTKVLVMTEEGVLPGGEGPFEPHAYDTGRDTFMLTALIVLSTGISIAINFYALTHVSSRREQEMFFRSRGE